MKQISSKWLLVEHTRGTIILAKFNLQPDGRVLDPQIEKSSGSEDVDRAVMRLLVDPNIRARPNANADTLEVGIM